MGSDDPADTYRGYLSEIRRLDHLTAKELAGHLKRWQTVKDSVFARLRRDTLGLPGSDACKVCEGIHDSLRIEFSRLALSGPRTYGELLLLKVMANVTNRAELREIAGIYKAKIIDLSPDSMVFELTGRPEKIDAFLKLMSDYQILEQCRTGVTALERGGMHQHMQKPAQEVREAQFPLPGTRCR